MNIIECRVIHSRYIPKVYSFKSSFFWLKFSLLHEDIKSSCFWPYSFKESDHLNFGQKTLVENVREYIKNQGENSEIEDIHLYTNLSFFSYVFNPVSFFYVSLKDNKRCAIVQIGNTFLEHKPYFVSANEMNEKGFSIDVVKYFYISPFIKHDNKLSFKFREDENTISVVINDYRENGELELTASMYGKKKIFSKFELFKQTLKMPFSTFRIITLIHYHALKLYLMKIPYFKKSDNLDLQRGVLGGKNNNR